MISGRTTRTMLSRRCQARMTIRSGGGEESNDGKHGAVAVEAEVEEDDTSIFSAGRSRIRRHTAVAVVL